MSVLDISERRAYLNSPYFKKHEYSDFTPFYITVSICTIVFVTAVIINLVLGCCSKHSAYWNDRYTGNRYILSLWTATPHKQPPLDCTELNPSVIPTSIVTELPRSTTEYSDLEFPQSTSTRPIEYLELQHQKSRESDI
ncbi:PREDICTED: uncharacterized protein LOC108565370 [Nicrophorus vespilloides]|uniref:Uncharacterized protein LOC108565370 n=1 Tax=Nicrophorus vespilloides TaxID=110193 RepID=A0ABM1N0D2_NICVS|nr:PREDICTED: uncharacterized protein LOC108565370 [Nicrophorus vespilloides]